MNYISHIFSIFIATVLLILITSSNTSMPFFSQNLVLATTQEEQGNSSSSFNENEEFTGENESSETLQGSTDSEETEESNSDLTSSSDQNNECPEPSDLFNIPTFIGDDGCVFPCPSSDSVEQGSIPQGCPVGGSPQSSTEFNTNENQPVQSQQQQESTTQQPQQNIQTTTPSQNTFTNPGISSDPTTDTTNDIPNTGLTFTQKSINPSGQFKSGSDLTGLDIPKSFYNPSGPFNPGTGNPQREGITSQENTNPATPVDPGNIPSKIEDRIAYLTVVPKPNVTEPFEICVLISQPYEVQGNPYCVQTSGESTMHALQAPGLIDIKALTSKYDVDTSNCEFRIYPQQSESCVLDITVNPVIKSKSETTKQDTTLSFNR